MSVALKRNKWIIWKDVIFALFVREIRVGFNDKLGISWAIINPVAFIFILSFIRGRLDAGETYGMPTFVFIVYGMVTIQLFLQVFNGCSNSIKKSRPLFAFRQVQPISPVISSAIFEIFIKIFVLASVYAVMFLLQMEVKVAMPMMLAINLLSIAIFAMSLGMIFGLSALFIPEISKLQNVVTRPLFFISGVFFSIRDFPEEYWHWLDWNPILHAIELSRYAAYTNYGEIGVSHSFLFSTLVISLFLSLLVYRSTWKAAVSR